MGKCGTGADGALTISVDSSWSDDSYLVTAAATSVITCTNDPVNIAAGDEVLFIHIQGAAADTATPPLNAAEVGKYEFLTVDSVNHVAKTITCTSTIVTVALDTGGKTYAVRVPNYTNVTINSTKTLSSTGFLGVDGATGIICFRATGTVNIVGSISCSGGGFIGGSTAQSNGGTGGTSWGGAGGAGVQSGNAAEAAGGGGGTGTGSANANGGNARTGGGGGECGTGTQGTSNNGGAGGGGSGRSASCGGGGGGYGTAGENGTDSGGTSAGDGGAAFGDAPLAKIYLGCGGGGGGQNSSGAGGQGQEGGGIIMIFANIITVTGSITANGDAGAAGTAGSTGGGGGGSGGAILLNGNTITLGAALVTSLGGAAGAGFGTGTVGGAGGSGRIAVKYAGSVSGTTNPAYNSSFEAFTCSALTTSTTGIRKMMLMGVG